MRAQIHRIADEAFRAHGVLRALYVFTRFDETPLRLTVVDKNVFFGLPQEVVDEHEARDAGVAKLLQLEVEVRMLIECVALRAPPPVHPEAMPKLVASAREAPRGQRTHQYPPINPL
eukprot:2179250-Pyramimonas_sp.AAC.1